MEVDPPRASPRPNYPPDSDSEMTTSGVFQVVTKVANNTKVQWVVIGAFLLSFGAFAQYVFSKADLVNSAMAQAKAVGDSNTEDVKLLKQRIETIDAGTRGDIQRLERKIDANNEQTERKLSEILRAVKAK